VEKNDFVKNLDRYEFENKHQNNYVRNSNNATKSFGILVTNLSVLHNYFDTSTKLFSDLQYLTKCLNTSVKLFFPCTFYILR